MRKIGKIIVYILSFLAAYTVVSFCIVLVTSLRHPEVKQSDAGIILGAGVYTPSLYNRTLSGLKVYEEGKVPVLVLSGGRTNPAKMAEAEYMQSVIFAMSTSSVPTLLEDKSASTYENFKFSRQLVPNAKSIVIASDCFHIARAKLMAKHFGFTQISYTCPAPTYYPARELAYHYLRETAGYMIYAVRLPFMD